MDENKKDLKKIVSILYENRDERYGERSMGVIEPDHGESNFWNKVNRLNGWKGMYLNEYDVLLKYHSEYLNSGATYSDEEDPS